MLAMATPERDAWLQGYAHALATMNRQHDQPSYIADAFAADGLTGFQLDWAGAEGGDIRELRKAYKHLGRGESHRRWNGIKVDARRGGK